MAEHGDRLPTESADESTTALMPTAPSRKISVARVAVAAVGVAALLVLAFLAGSGRSSSRAASLVAAVGLQSAAFDGCWKASSVPEEVQEIKGTEVIWQNGHKTPVHVTHDSKLAMQMGGQVYHASLQNGRLHWDDGDRWDLAKGCDNKANKDPLSKGPEARDLKIHALLNDLRARGFSCSDGTHFGPQNKLKFDCRLWKAAKLHSVELQGYPFMGGHPRWTGNPHTNPKGEDSDARCRKQGYNPNSAENICMGWPPKTAERAVAGWKKSLGHCKNMGRKAHLHGVAGFENMVTSVFGDGMEVPDRSCLPANSNVF